MPLNQKIVDELRGKPMNAGQLGKVLGLSNQHVLNNLRELRQQGVVEACGDTYPRTWRVVDPAPPVSLSLHDLLMAIK